jgi:branched-subunit amino acid transport protein AzlD
MLILRFILMLALITLFVLLAAYVITKNKKYLSYMMVAVKYLGFTLAAMLVLYLVSRVIRF